MICTLEAAAILGIASVEVRELIYAHRLPAQKVGRSWIIQKQDAVRLAAEAAS